MCSNLVEVRLWFCNSINFADNHNKPFRNNNELYLISGKIFIRDHAFYIIPVEEFSAKFFDQLIIVTPQAVFIFSLVTYTPLTYNKTYSYPVHGQVIGWIMALSSILCIPIVMIINILGTQGNLAEVRFHSFILFAIKTTKFKTTCFTILMARWTI